MLFSRRKNSSIEFLIVGLGNPGRKYEKTRHNAGFIAVDALSAKHGIRVDRVKWNALTGDGTINGHRCLLMKPQTYMNNSGEAVVQAMRFYKLQPEQVIVLLDDITLEPGVMRIRRKGSDGGQKGMRSIIQLCGSDQFPRIKLGVGKKPHPDYELADWVLSDFSANERKQLDSAVENAVDAVALMVEDKTDEAMNKFSR
ncbi:MAG: aminoacyl-tRNA hydrolase [Ruminococcaceae bacterium]|nr:aminoacyl-tRNA hydrolase [Oscillospiraceae bacterium]